MKRAVLVGTMVLIALALSAPSVLAEHNEGGKRLEFEDCLNPDGSYGDPMECSYDEDGHLLRQPGSGGGIGFSFGTILFVGLLWSLVPIIIAVNIASARGQSVGGAALIALIGGWVGLAIVYFLMGEGSPVEKVLSPTSGDHLGENRVTASRPTPVSESSTAKRLTELQGLRDQGLISEDEFATRRTAIISEI